MNTAKQRIGAVLTSFALVAGGVVGATVVASPAQAACNSNVHWDDFWSSFAEAHTEDCSYISRSYAQHGSRVADSGWFSGWSRASADSGVSFSHNAFNQFA